MEILLSCTTIFVAVITYVLSVVFVRRKNRKLTWEQILEKISPLEAEAIASLEEIAQMYLHPETHQLRLQPGEMWQKIGGLRGLIRLRRNATAMLELAVYAEQWDDEKGVIIAEMIRRDVRRLCWVMLMVEVAAVVPVRYFAARVPFNIQEAAGIYMLIRSRLLTFYQTAHAGRLQPIAELL